MAVVDCGGVAAAAVRLNVTPPAVSIQLRTLEANIGGPVLHRPDLAPTAVGLEIITAARRIDTILSRTLDQVAALRSGRAGRVVLGVTSTGKYFAPFLIARIADAMPELDVSLMIGNRREIIAGLSEGRLDLAITGRPPSLPTFTATALGDHPHVWIAAPDHALSTMRAVPVDMLRGERMLTREVGSGTRMLMERFLDTDADVLPSRTMEFGSNETIKQAVMAGLGIALISGHTIVADLEQGRLCRLDVVGTPIVRRWFLTRLTESVPEAAVGRLRDFVVSLEGSFLPSLSSGWDAPLGPQREIEKT